MLFMVLERFRPGGLREVYARLEQTGRQLPDGLSYVDSWVDASLLRCFQLMECDDVTLLQEWCARWGELADFEIVPVTRSRDAAAAVAAGSTVPDDH